MPRPSLTGPRGAIASRRATLAVISGTRARLSRYSIIASVIAASALIQSSPALAQQSGPPPSQGSTPAPPVDVPGKEYVDSPNKDASGAADPERSLQWSGTGSVSNGFSFANTRPFGDGNPQLDDIANTFDLYFNEVRTDRAFLAFSVVGDAVAPIRFEAPQTGAMGIWATATQINSQGVNDLKGLELFGPAGSPDSDAYSLKGDPINPGTGQRTSVWLYDHATTSEPLYTALDIALAIGRPDLELTLDVDALMVSGESLIFSIAAVDNLNGGEIWTWSGSGRATFLQHGGHTWDTAFGATIGDIDAIEAIIPASAVPEPAGVTLLSVGLLGLLAGAARRRPKRS